MISGKPTPTPELEVDQETFGQVLDLRKPHASSTTITKEKNCSWCGKRSVTCPNGLVSSTWTYCSQRCYEKFRRAVFKKRSACLWCSNLEGRPGDRKLSSDSLQSTIDESKFCSDCCLTQFKLQLFCEETTSHLNQIQENDPGERHDLITPALWLRKDTALQHDLGTTERDPSEPPVSPTILSSTTVRPGPRGNANATLKSPSTNTIAGMVTTRENRRSKFCQPRVCTRMAPYPQLPLVRTNQRRRSGLDPTKESMTSSKLEGGTSSAPISVMPPSVQISLLPIPFPLLFPIILTLPGLQSKKLDPIEDLE